ncbi:MFS transporter [Streptomyces sp. DSM 41972]|uniref:MFS transporter n=1 Tax=Streptomyces althioticus subsp. attaecolombicae TaxID=3075534 RepID=A0ABU3HTK9_9ACTN|nr:MFS transporter [Streptomyces sp. DSM 41972]SCD29229.1 Major Facilitator Superfamily protein [Streptomyces sp. di188]SCD42017.1 Major Facilitator Superfamily protein [Streptomyces sp. di50b]
MKKSLVPPPGPARTLALAQLISRTGDGAYYVTAALFFTQVAGLSAAQLGLGLTIAWSVALVLGVPLGHLTDRRGARGTAAFFFLCAAVAVGSYLVIRSFPLFVAAASLYAIGQRSGSAAQQALLAGVVPKKNITQVRAFLQACYNAGLSVGAALGGMVLLFDIREAYLAAFALNACAFVVAALVLLRVPATAPTPAAAPGEKAPSVLRDRPYVVVSLLNLILVLHVPLIDVALPLWIVGHTEAPKWVLSVMFVLNTLAVVVFQVRVSRGVTGMASAARYVVRGGLLLGAGCVVFAFSGSGGSAWSAILLLAAAAVQTLGEMVQMAGTWEISFGLAPDGRHGQYQAFFGSGLTIAEIVGPLALTGLLVYWGAPGWILLGALFAAAGCAMVPAVRWGERRLAAAQPAPDGAPKTTPAGQPALD